MRSALFLRKVIVITRDTFTNDYTEENKRIYILAQLMKFVSAVPIKKHPARLGDKKKSINVDVMFQ